MPLIPYLGAGLAGAGRMVRFEGGVVCVMREMFSLWRMVDTEWDWREGFISFLFPATLLVVMLVVLLALGAGLGLVAGVLICDILA